MQNRIYVPTFIRSYKILFISFFLFSFSYRLQWSATPFHPDRSQENNKINPFPVVFRYMQTCTYPISPLLRRNCWLCSFHFCVFCSTFWLFFSSPLNITAAYGILFCHKKSFYPIYVLVITYIIYNGAEDSDIFALWLGLFFVSIDSCKNYRVLLCRNIFDYVFTQLLTLRCMQ